MAGCSTNMSRSCEVRRVSGTHRRDGQMALRWCAAGMVEAGKQFGRVNGYLHRRALRTALERHVAAENVSADRHNDTTTAA